MRIQQLDRKQEKTALSFLAQHIPDVDLSAIGHTFSPETMLCQQFLDREVAPHVGRAHAVMIPHIWIGAYDGKKLVGAVHAAPLLGEMVQNLDLARTGRPGAGSPQWRVKCLNTAARIEEIAVHPDYRRQGAARHLLTAAHEALRAHQHPYLGGVESVNAWAGSTAAQQLFASLGYTIGEARTPVPPEYQAGMGTLWDPRMDQDPGSYVWGHLSDLA